MLKATRLLFNNYVERIAEINEVSDTDVTATKFTIAPAVEQTLEEKLQVESDFLSRINFELVVQQEGDKVGVNVTRTIAGRTNTAAGNRRTPTDPTDTSDEGRYRCEKTDFDTAIKYSKLDAWRHKPEFQNLLTTVILKQQGRDRIMIGWNGVDVAVQTDRVAYPLLQDVNKGWLFKIRAFAPARVLNDGDLTVYSNGTNRAALKAIYVADVGELYDGTNATTAEADYVNLDALVKDATELLDEWHRDDTDLVVILGRDLQEDKYFPIINSAANTATEIEARDRILESAKKIGGKKAVAVPFFPANALLITSLDNLSIYAQEGTRRRQIKDEPALDQIEDYQSVNEAYVVEDYGRSALVENIVMGPAPARAVAP
ncbi:MAG: P2 family phage major capsid protein [Alphaproteobacteria bacterium]|nr:MAG: P2 family phage major capsid protein [Alphaproteobacteria bacterium]